MANIQTASGSEFMANPTSQLAVVALEGFHLNFSNAARTGLAE
jgi:hypothetical protein